MSKTTSCAHCGQQVPIPDGLDPGALVRCPLCGAEFPLLSAAPSAAGPGAPSPPQTDSPTPIVARIAPEPIVARLGPEPIVAKLAPEPIVARVAPGQGAEQAGAAKAGPADLPEQKAVSGAEVEGVSEEILLGEADLFLGESESPDDQMEQFAVSADLFADRPEDAAPVEPVVQTEAAAAEAQEPAAEAQPVAEESGWAPEAREEPAVADDLFGDRVEPPAPAVESPVASPVVPTGAAAAGPLAPAGATQFVVADMGLASEALEQSAISVDLLNGQLGEDAPAPESAFVLAEAVAADSQERAGAAQIVVEEVGQSLEAMEELAASADPFLAGAALTALQSQEIVGPVGGPVVQGDVAGFSTGATTADEAAAGSAVEEDAEDSDLLSFVPSGTRVTARLAPGARSAGPASSAAETPSVTIPARFRKKRGTGSGIRGTVGVLLSGLLGMGMIYYLFNLLGGPQYDFAKFPLPGVKHTYKHLDQYPWLPRFGIDPSGATPTPESEDEPETPAARQKPDAELGRRGVEKVEPNRQLPKDAIDRGPPYDLPPPSGS